MFTHLFVLSTPGTTVVFPLFDLNLPFKEILWQGASFAGRLSCASRFFHSRLMCSACCMPIDLDGSRSFTSSLARASTLLKPGMLSGPTVS